jgi:hypothetical protein
VPAWVEDESAWIDLFPFNFSDQRLDLGEAEVAKVLGLVATVSLDGA